jgi:hypothetical protein
VILLYLMISESCRCFSANIMGPTLLSFPQEPGSRILTTRLWKALKACGRFPGTMAVYFVTLDNHDHPMTTDCSTNENSSDLWHDRDRTIPCSCIFTQNSYIWTHSPVSHALFSFIHSFSRYQSFARCTMRKRPSIVREKMLVHADSRIFQHKFTKLPGFWDALATFMYMPLIWYPGFRAFHDEGSSDPKRSSFAVLTTKTISQFLNSTASNSSTEPRRRPFGCSIDADRRLAEANAELRSGYVDRNWRSWTAGRVHK